jgi:hypothetical protein
MSETPEALLHYFAAREAERNEQVNRVLESLTERERALIREAAVMGYVQGTLDQRAGVAFPKDSAILWMVIDACRAHSDRYPLLSMADTSEEPDENA